MGFSRIRTLTSLERSMESLLSVVMYDGGEACHQSKWDLVIFNLKSCKGFTANLENKKLVNEMIKLH
jgi:hypothetical protein